MTISKEKAVIQPAQKDIPPKADGQIIQTSNETTVSQEEAVKQPTQLQPIHDEQAFKDGIDYFLKGQYKKALEEFQKLADTKYAPSYLYLAMIHQKGKDLDRNESKKWYEEAGKEIDWFKGQEERFSNGNTQYHLALCNWNACGLEQNFPEALRLFKLAAEKDHALAQKELGLYYLKEENKDLEQALPFLEKAANQNCADAQYLLGDHYYENKDYKKAVALFERAAHYGHAEAQCNLGVCYFSGGYGIDKDTMKAASWFKKSSDNGNAKAKKALLSCY